MDIQKTVRDFITTNFYVPERFTLTDGTSLIEVGIVDSTGVLEVIGFIETEFGLQVQDDEVVPENLDSIERISRFIQVKLSSQAAA